MTMRDDGPDDSDLRQAFAVLRREEAEGAPTFEAVRARVRPRRLVPVAGLLAAASVAVAILGSSCAARIRRPPTVSMGEWIAPTDFLLDTPGREILETVPRFGGVDEPRSVSP